MEDNPQGRIVLRVNDLLDFCIRDPRTTILYDCRLPIADCRLPIADCRLPVSDILVLLTSGDSS